MEARRRFSIITASLIFALAAALALTSALACSDNSGNLQADDAAPEASAPGSGTGEPSASDEDARPVLLFTIGRHIEPPGPRPGRNLV